MPRFNIRAKTYGALRRETTPSSPGQPEALPHVLFDTQAWTTAVTTNATYFAGNNTDPTMGNVSGGQLPADQAFEVHYVGVDFLLAAINAAAPAVTVSQWADLTQFLWTQRGILTLTISNKDYIVAEPLSFFHGSGGPMGFGYSNSATTGRFEYGNNGVMDGGYCVGGAITIPGKITFSARINLAAAPTLGVSPLNVRVWMLGVLSRRVL
ncbi:MAG: hypothetical protein ACRD0K_10165 [Egibacteraceae bacterium]